MFLFCVPTFQPLDLIGYFLLVVNRTQWSNWVFLDYRWFFLHQNRSLQTSPFFLSLVFKCKQLNEREKNVSVLSIDRKLVRVSQVTEKAKSITVYTHSLFNTERKRDWNRKRLKATFFFEKKRNMAVLAFFMVTILWGLVGGLAPYLVPSGPQKVSFLFIFNGFILWF